MIVFAVGTVTGVPARRLASKQAAATGSTESTAVTDDEARRAAADLGAAGISSGPSGAASLAGVRAALTGNASADRRAFLAVDSASVIVLLNTEAGDGR